MKFIRQILYVLLLIIPALPASAQEEGEKKGVDLQEVLWGHIKDAYHWHIMDIGGEPVVIHLPVIVKSSTGWHVFSSSQFAEEPDADGNAVVGGDVRLFGCKDCFVHTAGEKTVVVEGLEGYIVAESADRLLVCRLSEEQRIKEFSSEKN